MSMAESMPKTYMKKVSTDPTQERALLGRQPCCSLSGSYSFLLLRLVVNASLLFSYRANSFTRLFWRRKGRCLCSGIVPVSFCIFHIHFELSSNFGSARQQTETGFGAQFIVDSTRSIEILRGAPMMKKDPESLVF